MAAGNGTRWNNYTGVPKHMAKIQGETLLHRTVRLLRANNIKDIRITSDNPNYQIPGAKRYEPKNNVYEIDRFCNSQRIWTDSVCFLYGDVYYTEEALKTIVETETDSMHYFGRRTPGNDKNYAEIFAIKVQDTKQFLDNCMNIRQNLIKGAITRGIGWETYKIFSGIDLNANKKFFREWLIKDDNHPHFTQILDDTEDVDTPKDYWAIKARVEKTLMFRMPRIDLAGTTMALANLLPDISPYFNIKVNAGGIKNTHMRDRIAQHSQINDGATECDILVYTNPFDDFSALKYNAAYPVRWCHTCVSQIRPKTTKKIQPGHYITVSAQAQKELAEHGINSQIIPNILHPDIHILAAESVKMKDVPLRLVTVSRLTEQKGLNRMYQLAVRLRKAKVNFVWYIIGEPIPSPDWYMPECIFLGLLNNPYPYIANASYLVQLSDYESDGFVIREALELGTPIIATRWEGIENLIQSPSEHILLDMDMSNLDVSLLQPFAPRVSAVQGTNSASLWLEFLESIPIKMPPAAPCFTIYTIAYNGYGKYAREWAQSILNQTIKTNGIIVLGENHGASSKDISFMTNNGIKVIMDYTPAPTMGYLLNKALDNANSEHTNHWLVRVDVDDRPTPNATATIEEMSSDYDAIGLRYLRITPEGKRLGSIPLVSAIFPTAESLLQWDKLYRFPGYCAMRYSEVRYEETNIPNYPYLFDTHLNAPLRWGQTKVPIIHSVKHDDSHGSIAERTGEVNAFKKHINAKAEAAFEEATGGSVEAIILKPIYYPPTKEYLTKGDIIQIDAKEFLERMHKGEVKCARR
jgi:glycosyltransferase involved in cell wall biosynthesis